MIDWTKIKTNHFLISGYTPIEKGNLITLLCLTAHLEKMPSQEEMLQVVHYKSLIALQETLNRHSIDLQQVLNKVLEDVQRVIDKRASSRSTSKTYREKNIVGDTSRDVTEKIIEDNTKEDKKKKKEKKKKDKNASKINFSKLIKMTQEEYDELIRIHGKFHTEKAIYAVDKYKLSNGKTYKSDYGAILSWGMGKVKKEFPIAQHQDGKKEEEINRKGVEKIKQLLGGVCGKTTRQTR